MNDLSHGNHFIINAVNGNMLNVWCEKNRTLANWVMSFNTGNTTSAQTFIRIILRRSIWVIFTTITVIQKTKCFKIVLKKKYYIALDYHFEVFENPLHLIFLYASNQFSKEISVPRDNFKRHIKCRICHFPFHQFICKDAYQNEIMNLF